MFGFGLIIVVVVLAVLWAAYLKEKEGDQNPNKSSSR